MPHKDPEIREGYLKEYNARPESRTKARNRNKKYDSKPDTKEERRKYRRVEAENIIKILGSKCDSCGEKYNPILKRVNLAFHHKFYSEQDLKRRGNTLHRGEMNKMIKENKINELKKKFTLLCHQCNSIEAFVRKDKVKAFETFCWLYGEGYFDEALKDDAKFKKLSEFMN